MSKTHNLVNKLAGLEEDFLELSKNYYTDLERFSKLKFSEASQQPLSVRYSVKTAFYCELKQNLKTALKEYIAAYVICKSIPIFPILELKHVAGLLMAKVLVVSDGVIINLSISILRFL